MKTQDFDFELDEQLIAQSPSEQRDHCRLMVMDRHTGERIHTRFDEIVHFLKPGDCLVINDTKVIPARLFGARPGREEKIEVLLLQKKSASDWACLVKPGRKMKVGTEIIFSEQLRAEVVDIIEEGQRILRFSFEGIFEEILDQLGQMPLPPYITKQLENKEDYQTVYARVQGSAAAPTAGLHFTKELLETLQDRGVQIAPLTLHVGLGTFRPVKEEEVESHHMHAEYYMLSKESAECICQAKERGGRIISVGTTSTRTLESVVKKHGKICEDSGWTDIFIYPGYQYEAVDGIITNFHLPKSSLIMMIAAFTGQENILEAYKTANAMRYRFFSFGDAMLILPLEEAVKQQWHAEKEAR